MAKQFSVAEDVAYTCETAAHFWLMHVLARWEKFLAQVRQSKSAQSVQVRILESDLPFPLLFFVRICLHVRICVC